MYFRCDLKYICRTHVFQVSSCRKSLVDDIRSTGYVHVEEDERGREDGTPVWNPLGILPLPILSVWEETPRLSEDVSVVLGWVSLDGDGRRTTRTDVVVVPGSIRVLRGGRRRRPDRSPSKESSPLKDRLLPQLKSTQTN